ncbi:MAG: DUF2914 domain-containing protein [Kofleriaceae bacterium]|nr:DUF2914 domain-containing protein [Kofleriaceae bacterium]
MMRTRKIVSALALIGMLGATNLALAGDDGAKDKPAPAKPAPAKPAPTNPGPVKPAPAKPAPPPDAAPAPTADGASAEVKAAKAIANKEPVDEATSFADGDKVWAWSKIVGAKDTTVKHVWKRDGQVIWEKELTIGSNQWRTYTRRTVHKGSYAVEVQAADGTVLGSAEFTVE